MTDEDWCRDNPEEAVLHIEKLEQQLASLNDSKPGEWKPKPEKTKCDRCGKPTKRKQDILCPDCGRAHIISLDVDKNDCCRGKSRYIR